MVFRGITFEIVDTFPTCVFRGITFEIVDTFPTCVFRGITFEIIDNTGQFDTLFFAQN